ncbi:MAG: TerC family protein [Cytophagales bacterium]
MEILVSLISLTLLEIVLGIDNVIFISILVDKIPISDQKKARIWGLSLALICRIMLLFTVSWLVHLTTPLFTIFQKHISVKDLILISGGLFLIYKSTKEIYEKVEKFDKHSTQSTQKKISFSTVILQIIIIDIVFSLDSIITAIGLVDSDENPAKFMGIDIPLLVIITAVIISMAVMIVFARHISEFINNRPSVKILALAFLILIGTMLLAEGLHIHFPKGYIYFAMGFAMIIDFINIRMNKNNIKTNSK